MNEIAIYTKKNTSRFDYITEYIFSQRFGLNVSIYTDWKKFSKVETPRVAYGKNDEKSISIHRHGLLSEKGIEHITITRQVYNEMPVFFLAEESNQDFPFDLLSFCFYCLSRYEEYGEYQKDTHGRFKAQQSVHHQFNFLNIPIADYWIEELRKALVQKYPALQCQEGSYSVHPSIDVDVALSYKGKGFIRTAAGVFKELVQFRLSEISRRFKTILGLSPDPNDTFDFVIQEFKQRKISDFLFFIAVADYSQFDKNNPYRNRVFQSTIKHIGDFAKIGLHSSYYSLEDSTRLHIEKKRLESISMRPIKDNRGHYIRIKLPETYRNLINTGINEDYTMGYPSLPGFRAGTCFSFPFYDLLREEPTNLTIHPFCLMDATFKNYLRLSTDEAFLQMTSIIDEVKKYKGQLHLVWHNDNCSLQENIWRKLFSSVLDYAVKE